MKKTLVQAIYTYD